MGGFGCRFIGGSRGLRQRGEERSQGPDIPQEGSQGMRRQAFDSRG